MSHLPTSPQNVPVFNCVVHVAPPAADGTVVARVANLPGLEAADAASASPRQVVAVQSNRRRRK
jgi:hypothetical protein